MKLLVLRGGSSIPMDQLWRPPFLCPHFRVDSPLARKLYVAGHVAWSFYADDPENSKTAHDMGIIMGTSHHEPMARNHQEWARKRKQYGVWDYATNQKVLDRFFREG